MTPDLTHDDLVAQFRAAPDAIGDALKFWHRASFVPAKSPWQMGTFVTKNAFAHNRFEPQLNGFYVPSSVCAGAAVVAGFELGEHRGSSWFLLIRPKNRRRWLGGQYIGRLSTLWWTPEERKEFAALLRVAREVEAADPHWWRP